MNSFSGASRPSCDIIFCSALSRTLQVLSRMVPACAGSSVAT
ncbi:MAG: hypothetical protein U1F43_18675 [Myxococcota bacterium]